MLPPPTNTGETMSTIMGGAYSRETGMLIDKREVNGRKSSSYMEEQFIMLIGHELPQQVALSTMQKQVFDEELKELNEESPDFQEAAQSIVDKF